jgi:hypothetical protein
MLLMVIFLPTKESFVTNQKLSLPLILPNKKLSTSIESKDKLNHVLKILEISWGEVQV